MRHRKELTKDISSKFVAVNALQADISGMFEDMRDYYRSDAGLAAAQQEFVRSVPQQLDLQLELLRQKRKQKVKDVLSFVALFGGIVAGAVVGLYSSHKEPIYPAFGGTVGASLPFLIDRIGGSTTQRRYELRTQHEKIINSVLSAYAKSS